MMENIDIPMKYVCENTIYTITVAVSPGSITGVHALTEDQQWVHTWEYQCYKGNTRYNEQQTEKKKGEDLNKEEKEDMDKE